MSDHTASPVVVDPFLDEYVMDQTRIRARDLAEKSNLPSDACEDIQQEMTIALLKARKRFNPAKAGMHTFACHVMDCFSKVLNDLPKDLRSVCKAMLHMKDRRAIAEKLGISRSSLYRRIERIQARFRAAGLEPDGI